MALQFMAGFNHHHHHHAQPADGTSRVLQWSIGFNLCFVLGEACVGFWGDSVALLADAGHNLGDVLGLGVSFLALRLAQRAPSRAFTYGWGSGTIYAALFNVLLILLACGAIAVTACQRLLASAPPVSGPAVAVVALLGILVNGATAWALRPHHGHDLNLRSAYWHMMTDAAVSAGVAVTGLLVALTHFYWLDAAVSLAVVAIIVVATWDIVRDTLRLMLAGVPAGIDPARVAEHLRGMEGVSAVHDLHIWSISTKDVALTAHLVLPGGHPGDAFLRRAAQELQARFHIGHVTLQVENRAEDCRLAPDHVI